MALSAQENDVTAAPDQGLPAQEVKERVAVGSYGGRLRVRACGVLIEGDRILLARHQGIGPAGYLWVPPGGGVEFGQTITETVIREYAEETSLIVNVGAFIGVYEVIRPPLHAIELFYYVTRLSGKVSLGSDPEERHRPKKSRILTDLQFFKREDLLALPKGAVHQIATRWAWGLSLSL